MSSQIIDGKQIAKSIRNHIRCQVKKLDFRPGLAVIQIGTDPASTIYVNHKQKDCEHVGFHSEVIRLPSNTSQKQVIDLVKQLNQPIRVFLGQNRINYHLFIDMTRHWHLHQNAMNAV
mgnify:CR=1 FL=1